MFRRRGSCIGCINREEWSEVAAVTNDVISATEGRGVVDTNNVGDGLELTAAWPRTFDGDGIVFSEAAFFVDTFCKDHGRSVWTTKAKAEGKRCVVLPRRSRSRSLNLGRRGCMRFLAVRRDRLFWWIDGVYEVGGAAVFLEPPAACHCYPNLDTGIADVIALASSSHSRQVERMLMHFASHTWLSGTVVLWANGIHVLWLFPSLDFRGVSWVWSRVWNASLSWFKNFGFFRCCINWLVRPFADHACRLNKSVFGSQVAAVLNPVHSVFIRRRMWGAWRSIYNLYVCAIPHLSAGKRRIFGIRDSELEIQPPQKIQSGPKL